MKRGVVALAVLAALALGTVAPVADAAAQRPVRVAIIVGPVGDLTDAYRAEAEAAASEARRWSSDVVTVYSPNATWPAVRQALQGASIVVYLGHGNGWPSRYRDSLYPATQNGLGLNPVAGVDDTAHQYFGESYIERQIRLAPGAVVVLSHLCYASGNSEPGLPEGTLDQAHQRVDNFAAGWITAGASAVVAEAHLGPRYYVHALLSARRSVEQVWRASPTFNDHTLTFASRRSDGATTLMDPDKAASGFYRSLVLVGRAVSTPGGSGAPAAVAPPVEPPIPSLAAQGVRIGSPVIDGSPIAGSTHQLRLPVTMPASVKLPAGIKLGLRWSVIQLDPVASTDPANESAAGADPGPSPSPPDASPMAADPSASPAAASSPPQPVRSLTTAQGTTPSLDPSPAGGTPASPTPEPESSATTGEPASASPAPATRVSLPEPPEVQLVTAEATSDVVDVVKASPADDALLAAITSPSVPGLYRLTLSLHDPDGVAYDAATQALLPSLVVRVAGSVSVAYAVTPTLTAEAGHPFTLPVRVANTGDTEWGFGSGPAPDAPPSLTSDRVAVPWVMGHWIRLTGADAGDTPAQGVPVLVPPGESALAPLDLVAPAETGAYLLLIDTVTPAQGSLAALGVAPAVVRVTVVTPLPEESTRPK
jgi:hypothetical protein